MSLDRDDEYWNPLEVAQENYKDLLEVTYRMAEAAEEHPEIFYNRAEELEEMPLIEETNYNPSMAQAVNEMPVLSFFVSEKWSETQEYFMFDLERDFREYLRENEFEPRDQEKEIEYFEMLNGMYDKLENELEKLNEAVEEHLENPPAESSNERQVFTHNNQTIPGTAD